ncbi:hypothetical protein [Inquilinus sp. CA228]|uniref:hypothetical protein n=1 Tax=Inquilinus sp. CA228 TaxID=3455609 RepID=UPI003F8D3B38
MSRPHHLTELDEAEAERVAALAHRLMGVVTTADCDEPRVLLNAILALYRAAALGSAQAGFCPTCVSNAMAVAQTNLRNDLATNAATRPQFH